MSEPIKCAECQCLCDEDDLVYNDEVGADLCADCNDNAEAEAALNEDSDGEATQ